MKIGRLRLGRDDTAKGHAASGSGASLGETVALLRRYVIQETVGPLKHLGRVLAFGAAGALAFGVGGLFVVVGTLRLIQAESGSTFSGNWSFAPYVFSAVTGAALVGLFAALSFRGLGGRGHARQSTREER